jgi:hypothetical protein
MVRRGSNGSSPSQGFPKARQTGASTRRNLLGSRSVEVGVVLRSKLIATACVLCAVSIAIGCGVAVGQEKSGFQAQTPASPNCPSSSEGAVVQTLRMPGRPGFLLLAKNTLWVAIASARPSGRGALVRIDARSGRVQRIFRLPVNPYQLAFGFGSLWVTGETTNRRYQGRLLRIDPSTGRVLRLIRGPQTLGAKIATTSDAVWIGGADIFPHGHSERAGVRFVYKIDPRRNAVVRRVRLPAQATVIDLQGDGRSLWSAGWWGVVKLSAAGRVLFVQRIDGSGWSLAQTPGAVWVAQPFFGSRPVRRQDRPARRLLRIATSGARRISVMELQTQPGHVSSAAGVVWVTANGGLARIDLAEMPPTLTTVPVDFSPNYHVPFAGGLWVSDLRANRVHKIC